MVLLRGRENKEEVISRVIFPIGIFSMCISILLSRFPLEMPFFAFIEGFLLGIAVLFLIIALYFFGRKRRREAEARSNKA